MGIPSAWIAAFDADGISCGSLTVAFGGTGRDRTQLVVTHVKAAARKKARQASSVSGH